MMLLEEEKILVAKKVMGWEIIYSMKIKGISDPSSAYIKNIKTLLKNWNPQEERKWWDDIWRAKGFGGITGMYYDNLLLIKPPQREPFIWLHTAKPEVCWKALIKTLGGNK